MNAYPQHHYRAITSVLKINGAAPVLIYGSEEFPAGEGTFRLSDISTDKALVDRLVELLNRNNVSSLHARDIVEDYLLARSLA